MWIGMSWNEWSEMLHGQDYLMFMFMQYSESVVKCIFLMNVYVNVVKCEEGNRVLSARWKIKSSHCIFFF